MSPHGDTHSVQRADPPRPVVVGEVLFDHFPDGSRVLGGAPFNLAWHLQALGLDPLLVTRVGADREGADVLAAMAGWGLDVSGVQVDPQRPTGAVTVRLEGGEPRFEIPPDQAWDHLAAAEALAAVAGRPAAVLCHGSLVVRGTVSRTTLAVLRDVTGVPVFVDVNLRDPFWTAEVALELVAGSRWAKLSERELADLGGGDAASVVEGAARLRARHGLDQVWVTRGALGALVVSGAGVASGPPPAGVEVVDTVGAGDAFSAMVVAGLLDGWPSETTLERALALSASVCGHRGATSRDRRPYEGLPRATVARERS